MRSRSAWAVGARNKVPAVLLVLGFAVGLTAAPSSARAEDQETKQARQHARNAKQYFDLGQWDEAIAEYREAYRLRSDPAFLFNIAQSYRRKGDLQPALDLYKNYLIENPTTPKRTDIEKRIQTLEEEMKKRPAAPASFAREPSPAAAEPSPKTNPPAPMPVLPAGAAPVTPGQSAPASVSGPAGALMKAAGYEPSAIGTFTCYGGIPDIFVQDIRDPVEVSHSVRFDTLMTDEEKSIAFARDILSLIDNR